jgi:hypothetical protein
VDGILNMMMNGVEVVPVVDLGDGDSASEGEGKCGNHVELFHRSFSPRGRFGFGFLIRRPGAQESDFTLHEPGQEGKVVFE